MVLSQKERLFSLAAALLAAALSFALFGLISYQLEQRKQERELRMLSDSAFTRTQTVMQEIESAFQSLQTLPASGCSEATLAQLRGAVKSRRFLKSASVELGQNIYCSDSGLVYRDKPDPDYITDEGTMVWLNKPNLFSTKQNTLYIQRGNMILSTLHELLLDVISSADTGIMMFSTKSGQVIARHPQTAQIDEGILERIASSDGHFSTKDHLYFFSHDPRLGIEMVTFITKESFSEHLFETIWLWFPISLLGGLLAGYAFFKRMELQYTPTQKLTDAINNRELLVHYQPIVSLHNGKCIGAETLVRWRGLDGSYIHPELFIPLAEESGLIESLTDSMFETAMQEMAERLKTGDFYISFNLSAHDMDKPRYFDMISKRLRELGIEPAKIAIEATERGFFDIAQANDIIRLYNQAGHSVFIDDFGTGYSSLSYLQKLAVDVIKIDKSFVDAIETGSATSSVIIHIIAMAKQLNLKIVAEGVESAAQADFLRQHGVDAGQGFYFAQPMPAADFLRYIDLDRDLADL